MCRTGHQDILAIESTSQYFGVYHVLGGVISPMDGIGPNDLNISSLIERAEEKALKEVIIALKEIWKEKLPAFIFSGN